MRRHSSWPSSCSIPRDAAHRLHFACMAIGDLAEAAAHSNSYPLARERLAEVETMVGDVPAE